MPLRAVFACGSVMALALGPAACGPQGAGESVQGSGESKQEESSQQPRATTREEYTAALREFSELDDPELLNRVGNPKSLDDYGGAVDAYTRTVSVPQRRFLTSIDPPEDIRLEHIELVSTKSDEIRVYRKLGNAVDAQDAERVTQLAERDLDAVFRDYERLTKRFAKAGYALP